MSEIAFDVRDAGAVAVVFTLVHGIRPSDFDPTGELSKPTISILANAGLSLRETPSCPDGQLLGLSGIGPRRLREIREADEAIRAMRSPWDRERRRLEHQVARTEERLRYLLEDVPREIERLRTEKARFAARIAALPQQDREQQ